ncbi:MAG: hypothetical protein GC168_10570 [Candidatus Hydrogenedens sp.]|nr:hypothetical protein [Candidatus Hydrogenedens sp.]
MNKTALGFGLGLVIIALLVVGYLAVSGGQAPAPAPAPQAAPAPVETPTVKAEAPAATPAPPTAPPRTPPVPSPDDLVPTVLNMGRIVNAKEVKAGEPIEVTVSISQSAGNDPVRALGLIEQIPEGFRFADIVSEKRPDLNRPVENSVEFAWFNIPQFPVEFTYRLMPGTAAAPAAEISGQTLYRTSGAEQRTDMLTTPFGAGATGASTSTPAPAAEPAAAPSPTLAPAPEAMPAENVPAVAPEAVQVVLSRTAAAPTYTPGQPVTLEATVEYAGTTPLESISVVEVLPEGWTFNGLGEGAKPDFAPQAGATGNLAFIWKAVPELPAKLTYTATPPEGATGVQAIRGRAIYRTSVQQSDSVEAVTEVTSN